MWRSELRFEQSTSEDRPQVRSYKPPRSPRIDKADWIPQYNKDFLLQIPVSEADDPPSRRPNAPVDSIHRMDIDKAVLCALPFSELLPIRIHPRRLWDGKGGGDDEGGGEGLALLGQVSPLPFF